MKKAIAVLVIIVCGLFLVSTGAEAGKKQVTSKIDMAQYTCKDLLSEESDDAGMVLIWIDGYLSGKTGDTTIDMNFLGELATEVGNVCRSKSSQTKILDVVKQVTE